MTNQIIIRQLLKRSKTALTMAGFALLALVFAPLLSSCSDETQFTDTIFIDPGDPDPSSRTYAFDMWLKENYLDPYNLQFDYKMIDMESDIDYNLVPATLDKAQTMAILIKHLWFDAYNEVAGEDFLKDNGPRFIHLIGSPAYNPSLGTIVLGSAEGGVKVTIYRCNALDATNIDVLNEFYFKTLHHEFAHILHQKKTFPKEFETYSAGFYNPSTWYDRSLADAAILGFVSPYAGSQPREDFVEVIANYIVKSDQQWASLLQLAAQPGPGAQPGDQIIKTKLEIARNWLRDAWKIDLEKIRKVVQRRQTEIDDVLARKHW